MLVKKGPMLARGCQGYTVIGMGSFSKIPGSILHSLLSLQGNLKHPQKNTVMSLSQAQCGTEQHCSIDKQCVHVCAHVLHLLHIEDQNMHSTRKMRTHLGSEDILGGSHKV